MHPQQVVMSVRLVRHPMPAIARMLLEAGKNLPLRQLQQPLVVTRAPYQVHIILFSFNIPL